MRRNVQISWKKMGGKAMWELRVPRQLANSPVGSVTAPEKRGHLENLCLETILRIKSPLFVFQWPEFMSVLLCPQGLCFCTLGQLWLRGSHISSKYISVLCLTGNIDSGKWGCVNFPWIFWCEWCSWCKGFPVKHVQIVKLILVIPLGFTSSEKRKENPKRQWLHNCMQMAKTHDRRCSKMR